MKSSLILTAFLILSANVFAQGVIFPEEVLPDSTIKFKEDTLVGPKNAELTNLFYVDGVKMSAHQFATKSRTGVLQSSNNLCILTVNKEKLTETDQIKLPAGKTVTLSDKMDLGSQTMKITDLNGNQFGIGNGYDIFGYSNPAYINPNENFSAYPLLDEKGTLRRLYCYTKYQSFSGAAHGHWVSDYKDTTLKGAFKDAMELNLVTDQSNKNINQGNPGNQEKTKETPVEKKKEEIGVIEG